MHPHSYRNALPSFGARVPFVHMSLPERLKLEIGRRTRLVNANNTCLFLHTDQKYTDSTSKYA
jgi:hypothetical protein